MENVKNPEYLYAYHDAIAKGQACNVGISGDSTSTPYFVPDARFTPIPLMKSLAFQKGIRGQAFLDLSHSGMTVADWADNYVINDRGLNCRLYMPRWGINKWSGETVADFEAKLEQGIQYFRSGAGCGVEDKAILLMMPNSVSDETNGRDVAWLDAIRPSMIRVAADYHCTFFDTAAMFPDSETGTGLWMDDPGGIGGIHPDEIMNSWIFGTIADLIWPTGVRSVVSYGKVPFIPSIGTTSVGGTTETMCVRTPHGVICGGMSSFPTTNIPALTQLCQLPAGYRPRAVESASVVAANAGVSYKVVPVQVSANGVTITLEAVNGVNTIMFGGLQFIGNG